MFNILSDLLASNTRLRLFSCYVAAILSACGSGHESSGRSGASFNTVLTSATRAATLLPAPYFTDSNQKPGISKIISGGKTSSPTPITAEKTMARSTLTKPATLTVLHIEDNPEHLRVMRSMFGSLPNLTLLEAHTGEYGIKLATANPPALIMLDMTLPGIDGTEVIRRLRNHTVTRNIPVISLTASSRALGVELNLAGFDDYLAKPVDAARLQVVLNRRLVDINRRPLEPTTVVKQ